MAKKVYKYQQQIDSQIIKRWTLKHRETHRGYRNVGYMFLLVSGLLFWYAWGFFVEMNLAAENYRYRPGAMLNAYRISGRGLTRGEWAMISSMYKATIAGVLGLMTLMMATQRFRLMRLGGAFYRDWASRTEPVESIFFDDGTMADQSDDTETPGQTSDEPVSEPIESESPADQPLPEDPQQRREMLLAELRSGYPDSSQPSEGVASAGDESIGTDTNEKG